MIACGARLPRFGNQCNLHAHTHPPQFLPHIPAAAGCLAYSMRVVLQDAKRPGSEKDLLFVPEQTFSDMVMAKNGAALLALHVVDPRRHDRKLPEPFRSLWLKLIGVADKPKELAKAGTSASAASGHVCAKCGKSFKKDYALATHVKREHPEPKKKEGEGSDADEGDDDDEDAGAMWDNAPPAAAAASTASGAGGGAGAGAAAAGAAAAAAATATAASTATASTVKSGSSVTASETRSTTSTPSSRAPASLSSATRFHSQYERRLDKQARDVVRSKRKSKRAARAREVTMPVECACVGRVRCC